ncbi:MAG: type II toxin-antitoxin system YoeB family toxin [Muribaculaceae bacterium]|nr:type II toxin-antitoxin system YoeB family toxin [Muribaculaceae bacterium]
MSYRIQFSNEAQRVIKKWKKSNPQSFKKLYQLLPELESHPRTGTGHPEPLNGGGDITYSRRLLGQDRIIYDIYDDVVIVLVISLEGLYGDK